MVKRPLGKFLVIAVAVVTLISLLYQLLVPGLSVARRDPHPVEVAIATWLLQQSVPDEAKHAANPLGPNPDPAAITAGHELFTQKCEVCHAYDGGGRTEVGSGQFPRTPVLR